MTRLSLHLVLACALSMLVSTEAFSQWGWTTPASPAPAQAPASAPPAQGGSRGENFSAGKSAAQLFASDCTGAGCHKSAQGLARDRGTGSLASFLREHYTNSRESASALAAYLTSLPSAARPDPKQQPPRAAARPDEKPAERKPPAVVPAATQPATGEAGDKPPARGQQRGRQAVAPAAPAPQPAAAAPQAAPPPPEPAVPAAPPEPPKPQWDIFD